MKKTVLLCDDDTDILELCKYIFEQEGFEAKVFSKMKDALEEVITSPPDLILLDIWMPGMSGIEVARLLKQNPKTSHIPILLFSANSELDQIANEVNANGYIKKPFNTHELKSTLNQYLKSNEESAD
jgi:CheY-like chemotaxis protein